MMKAGQRGVTSGGAPGAVRQSQPSSEQPKARVHLATERRKPSVDRATRTRAGVAAKRRCACEACGDGVVGSGVCGDWCQ